MQLQSSDFLVAGIENKFLYNGKEYEDDLGLNWYHYGARFYDPQLARWHMVDPADEFLSPYPYVGNLPTTYVDPDGRDAKLAINWLPFIWPAGFGLGKDIIHSGRSFELWRNVSFVGTWGLDTEAIENQLNSYISKWKTTAPAVSRFLDENTIHVFLLESGEIFQKGGYEEVNGTADEGVFVDHKMLLRFNIRPPLADYSFPSTIERTFQHELVHRMGHGEFGAFAATVASGVLKYEDLLAYMNSSPGYKDYVLTGIPDAIKNQYLDDKNNLKPGFKEAFIAHGKKIINGN